MIEEVKTNIAKGNTKNPYTILVLNAKIHLIIFSQMNSNMLIKTVCFLLT